MKNIAALYTKSLQAYSLVETIVSSVIFMIIFLIGMYTLTNLTRYDIADASYLVMEMELQKLRQEIILSNPFPTEQDYIYKWGEIHVCIIQYKNEVYQVEVTAVSQKGHKTIRYRFLQAAPLKTP